MALKLPQPPASLLQSPSGGPTGVAVYDLTAKALTKLNADPTYAALWMSDSRRAIYFSNGGGQLVVADAVTKQRTVSAGASAIAHAWSYFRSRENAAQHQ